MIDDDTVFIQDGCDLRIVRQLQFIRYEALHVRGSPPHFSSPPLLVSNELILSLLNVFFFHRIEVEAILCCEVCVGVGDFPFIESKGYQTIVCSKFNYKKSTKIMMLIFK